MPKLKVDKQELFAREYLKDLNATRAARRAGYSDDTAGQIGWQMLNLEEYKSVQDRVDELMKERAQDANVDAAYVLQKLKMISEARIEDYVELVTETVKIPGKGKGAKPKIIKEQVLRWKTFDKLSDEQKGAIQSIKQGRNGIEIKLYDKSWSLDMISKHIGLYEKDNEQKKAEGVALYLPDNGRGDAGELPREGAVQP